MAKTNKKTAQTIRRIGGPYLGAAMFCDNILEDTDRIMTAIRIHDVTGIVISDSAPPNVPSKEIPIPLAKWMFICLRTGDAPGKYNLRIVVEAPSGKRTPLDQQEVNLPAEGGLNIRYNTVLMISNTGPYWFDIFLDKKLLTRVPLRVDLLREPIQQKTDKSG